MEGGSIWSELGSSIVSSPKASSEIEELKRLIQQVQTEVIGSVEALGRRIAALEASVSDMVVTTSHPLDTAPQVTAHPNEFSENALLYMSKEELGMKKLGVWPEVSDEVEGELLVAEDESGDEEHGRGNYLWWAKRTLSYIKEKGGVVNQYLKRFGLIPDDISKEERIEFKEELKQLGVQTYVVNQIRHFYYIGEDGESQYETVYGK